MFKNILNGFDTRLSYIMDDRGKRSKRIENISRRNKGGKK